MDPPYEESPAYKHALTVVSKAAYKTLKRGASTYLGAPPQVSFSVHSFSVIVLDLLNVLEFLSVQSSDCQHHH